MSKIPVKNVTPEEKSLYVAREKIQVREVHGFFQKIRSYSLWGLMALFFATSWLTWGDRQAVLLRKDGIIMQMDGTPGIAFNNVITGTYHLAIFHRNHLGVMSSIPVVLDNATYIYDFTQASWKAFGESQLKPISNIFAMYAGDMNGDHIINNEDYNYYKLNNGSNIGYSKADLDGDKNSNNQDYNLWFENRSKIGKM